MISKSTEHLYLASHFPMSLEKTPYLAASANLVDFGSSEVLRYCKMPSSLGLLYLKTETMRLIESLSREPRAYCPVEAAQMTIL